MNRMRTKRLAANTVTSGTSTDLAMAEQPVSASNEERRPSFFQTMMVLFKARVVSLLVLSAVGGAFLGANGWPGWDVLGLTILTGWLAASGSSALNQYIERKTDAQMSRTVHRPLIDGSIRNPKWVPWVALAMIVVPVAWTATFNVALAFWLAAGAFIYVVIYTIWLKPRTPVNIVIGGAAGSAAVLAGAAAAGMWNQPGAIVLALLVFLWTPTHFWSLAIVYRNDYAKGGMPMLPVIIPPRKAAFWVLLHTMGTALAAVVLALDPALGLIYLIPVAIVTIDMLVRNVRLTRVPTGKNARSLFMASNFYLMIVLVMICVNAAIPI
ncbi:MAG: heme o synthase [Anaerolineae bacterium]|nr:heme o synthase [Anaerolineae bacterium]